jgi:hypothetical protein
VTPAELLNVLQDFHRETLDLFTARQTIARSVAGYDANNGYQQVLGRQDVHLSWLADAIASLGGTLPDAAPQGGPARPERESPRALIESDVHSQQAFIDRWTPRVPTVTNARHRKMLELILGEMKEHRRVLEQAADGRSDLLGRHPDGKVPRARVTSPPPTI